MELWAVAIMGNGGIVGLFHDRRMAERFRLYWREDDESADVRVLPFAPPPSTERI